MNRSNRPKFNQTRVTALSVAICSCISAQINAQEDVVMEEEVVVSGYRQSLKQALDVKRDSSMVVEAIGSDTIGQLPDVTIAETLVRLPGITGSRDRGNQSQAAIRGLGPRLVFGLVNGREVASSEPTRSVRWEVYPSEVVSGAKVYKAQSADIVAGGVAGTVDIQTLKPLDYTGESFQGRVGAVHYGAGADIPDYDPLGHRASLSYVGKVSDEFAFNIGVSTQNQKNGFESFQGWGFNDDTLYGTDQQGDLNNDGVPDATPWGAQTEVKRLDVERVGFNGAIQWRPTASFEINADMLYSDFDIAEDQNQVWYGRDQLGNWRDASNPSDNGSFFDAYNAGNYSIVNGDVVAATVVSPNNVRIDNVLAKYQEDKQLLVGGVNVKYTSDNWVIASDLSHSTAERTNQWAPIRVEAFVSELTFDMSGNGSPSISTDVDPTSVPQTLISAQVDGYDELNDEITAITLDFERNFNGTFHTLKFGGRYADRSKEFFGRQASFDPIVAELPTGYTTFELSHFDVPPLLRLDGVSFETLSNAAYGSLDVNSNAIEDGSQWTVDEAVFEAFVMSAYETSWGGKKVYGNLGARFVDVDTDSQGMEPADSGGFTSTLVNSGYSEILPSANLNVEFTEDLLLRFGLARVIARPPLDELRGTRSLDANANPPSGFGGNPYLDPLVANQLDISYEWYFEDEAMLATAFFYKDLESHIGYQTDVLNIEGTDYIYTGPFNGKGGGISGLEFTLQTPFYFISALENFGVYFNVALTDSDVKEFYPPEQPLNVDGYAEESGTLDFWYNSGPIELRLGFSYHSPYTIVGGWDGGDVRTLDEETIVDFSSTWVVNDNLSVRFQVGNLTDDESVVYRDGIEHRLGSASYFGRTTMLDFTFKY